MNLCTFNGCNRKVHGHGLCRPHLRHLERGHELRPLGAPTSGQPVTLEQAAAHLTERAAQRGECVEYGGCTDGHGYGAMRLNGRTVKAHRVAWQVANGPIPKGLYVLHSCDNRRCINPAHLRIGTAKENTADMIARGRQKFHGLRYRKPEGVERVGAVTAPPLPA